MAMTDAPNGVVLSLYVHENRRHAHVLLYEWLLEEARKLGIAGGSAFRAIASYGRHGVLHEEHFFELAGDLAVRVDFVVSAAQAQALLDHLGQQHVDVFHVITPATFGTTRAGA
jgi:PII-like signaling protein